MSFDTLIVCLDTDEGLQGWGEMAPLGAFYDPSFAGGARSALEELAPLILGQDPTQIMALARRMDFHLKGHPYAKSAIDMVGVTDPALICIDQSRKRHRQEWRRARAPTR